MAEFSTQDNSEVQISSNSDSAVAERMSKLPASALGLDDVSDDEGERRELENDAEVERDGPEQRTEGAEEENEGGEERDEAQALPETIKLDTGEEVAVAELIASHKAYSSLQGDARAILSRVEEQGRTEVAAMVQQQRAQALETVKALQTFVTALPQPQEPPLEMLNPQSQHYNPDQYHLAKAQYDRAVGMIGAARQQVQAAWQKHEQLREAEEAQETEREYSALLNKYPELRNEATRHAWAAEMAQKAQKHYGVSPDVLDANLKSHLSVAILKDALAYRELQAKSGTLKERAEAKAGATAKAVPAQAARATGQEPPQLKAFRDARQRLKETGKTEGTGKAWEQFV